MKRSLVILRSVAWLLTVTLLSGGVLRAQEAGELIVNASSQDSTASSLTYTGSSNVTGGTLIVNENSATSATNTFVFNGSTFTPSDILSFASSTFTAFNSGLPVFIGTTLSSLSGSIADLKVKPNHDGSLYHVGGTVWLRNLTAKAFHNVSATVYLSDDSTLSSDDLKLVTLNLTDYYPKGKIGKQKALSLPLKRKVPAAFASYLEGKYVIVMLAADELTDADTVPPIVVGPIKLP